MFSYARCRNNASDGPSCSSCKRQFDFPCAGISETNFRKLGERRSAWRCNDCKNAPSPSPMHKATPEITTQLGELQATLKNISKQLLPLASLIEDVKAIKLDLSNLKSSLEFTQETTNQLTTSVKSLETRISQVEKHTDSLKKDLDKFNASQRDKEQWERANNVEIKGVPLKGNENLYNIIDFTMKSTVQYVKMT
jgi:DNA repair exonuclease SbcCD ATPase subunit